jgi:hypothetical protein
MTTSRSLERRGAFTLACIMALLVIVLVVGVNGAGFAKSHLTKPVDFRRLSFFPSTTPFLFGIQQREPHRLSFQWARR